MKAPFLLILIFPIVNCTIGKWNMKRFVVVSDVSVAKDFYPRIRYDKPFHDEPEADIDTKKQICQDIVGSYLFCQNGKYLYQRPRGICPLVRITGRPKYDHPVQIIKIWFPFQRMHLEEMVFVCLVDAGKKGALEKYYISAEYELNAESFTVHEHTYGRFVFDKEKLLFGMAELTAEVFTSPDLSLEHLYLEQKRRYRMAYKLSSDPLCGLSEEDRKRVCAAVFYSKYFVTRVLLLGNAHKIEATCNLHTISFQTDLGKRDSFGLRFRERMLSCVINDGNGVVVDNPYLLSHAYQSNQIFAYVWNGGNIFLEVLLTNIRVIFEHKKHRRGSIAEETVYEDLQI